MKKIFLLLLLVPFFSFANFYEGTIKFTNGSTLKGLVFIPTVTDKTVFYKPSENVITVKYDINKIDQIEFYIKEENRTLIYVASLYYEISMMGKFKGLTKSKIWLELIYDGKLKIYKTGVEGHKFHTNTGAMKIGSADTFIGYYFKLPNSDNPQKIVQQQVGSLAPGQFLLLKMYLGRYLKEDCPTLVELLEKKEFKEKGYTLIGELYDQNCGK
ncbi:MAG: hypothetical protein V4548_09825 [Bacteroidota bacterium]